MDNSPQSSAEMSQSTEKGAANVPSPEDGKTDVSFNINAYRSASPGVAKRVVTEVEPEPTDTSQELTSNPKTGNDNVIDDITQKLADSLLDRPSARAPKNEYVSINQKLEEKRQQHIAAQQSIAESALSHSQQMVDRDIPAVHTSSSFSQLNNGVVSSENDLDVLLPINSRNGNASLSNTTSHNHLDPNSVNNSLDPLMDGSALNINKPVHSTNTPPSTQTLWENSNGLQTSDANPHASTQEVDILTAMSGEPTPNSLPQVTDGLSDGEISSDSDSCKEEEEEDVNDLHTFVKPTGDDGISGGRTVDPFFAQHQSIMKSKTPAEVDAMRAAIVDIKSAISNCEQPNGSTLHNLTGSFSNSDSTPIWEIRESYAETLRQQEEKRRQRMELEHRYEQEYRETQLRELGQFEDYDKRIMAATTLDDDSLEPMNTDYYSSDEDDGDIIEDDGSKSWAWSAHKKYSKVGSADGYERSTILPSTTSPQTSNVVRLAEHQMVTSPKASRRHHSQRVPRLSNSSYSSSSQSSMAPSTVVRCKTHGSPSPDSNTDTSSSNSWDYGDGESPVHLVPARGSKKREQGDYDTDEETDKLLNKPYQGEGRVDLPADTKELGNQAMKNKAKEARKSVTVYDPDEPTVLIEGILFRAAYLGSTQLVSDAQPSKAIRMMQAQEAVGRIKAPDGENQPSTDVDLFVSTEKVMVLNTDLQEIMMDHALRSISYIADIDHILVIMAKRSLVMTSSSSSAEEQPSLPANTQQKLICHIFETDEAHLIAQSIGQAFQVAYMEFLKANGIDDPNLHMKDTSYEDILEQQEIMNDELETFTRKDNMKDIVVPKSKGESLGIVIVESGWGSMVPTVVLANMSPVGPAARCGQLNIGDQIISVNGNSLVGLTLSNSQEHVKAARHLTAVQLRVISRPPVVEVLIKRPDKKYQLGFSVQNGVICSLLRGGIAERGGIRVGHRIIEINNQSVVAVAHEKIVHMLSTSIGEIHMKTMPMAVFRLLTGQEVPQYI